jgi:hypothetical protein
MFGRLPFSTPNDGAPQGFSCLLWTPMPRGFCTSRVNFARVTGFGWALPARDSATQPERRADR